MATFRIRMGIRRCSTMCLVGGLLMASLHRASFSQDSVAREPQQLEDRTSELQQLIDSADGIVQFPAGKLLISKPLEVDLARTSFRTLQGSSATTIVMAGAGPAIRLRGTHFKSADPGGFSEQVWNRERMPIVKDVAITASHPEADGIEAIGTMQLTVSRVHLRKVRHGIRLRENNRNVIVDACHIYECSGVGIYYDDVNLHQSNIVGSHISYCAGGGIVSRAGNVRNIHIAGCDLESNMAADQPPTANVLIDCRNSRYGTAEVAITGCTIQHNDDGPESANIRIIGSSIPPSSSNGDEGLAGANRPGLPLQSEGHVTITGNVLSDVKSNIHLDGCRGVVISGNTFWMGFQHNLLVENSSHIVLGTNNMDRNPRYAYGNSREAQNRVEFRNCQDCTISGLHLSGIRDLPALRMEACERFNVSALTILDCELAMELVDVSRSRFTSALIDASGIADAQLIRVSGGNNNYFDPTYPAPRR